MKTYTCECGELLYFENVACVNCRREVGFLSEYICVSSLEPAQNGLYAPNVAEAKGQLFKKCQNYAQTGVCNWMVSADSVNEPFCTSCRLNVVIPDLNVAGNIPLWAAMEAAKRRLVYSARRLNLPLANRTDDPTGGLGFRFLADTVGPDGSQHHVMTEHDHGLITLNLAEADDAAREKIRLGMKEPYRTLLGHFRHETGHYYWDRLVLNSKFIEPFRSLFGDDRKNYDEAMKAYYASGPPANWQNNYISMYATMHPWEDWAETWAHYLHIQDTLEVAADFGLVSKRTKIEPIQGAGPKAKSFDSVMEEWAELTIALNCINRSMGLRDLYPFVLSKPVGEKLCFISDVIAG